MQFCPQCGVPVTAGARFCVECGENLAVVEAATNGGDEPQRTVERPEIPVVPAAPRQTGAFIAVLAGVIVVGVAVAFLILRQLPGRERLLASAPAPQTGTTSIASGELPPGHPKVALPQKARDLLAQIEHKARQNPKDIAAWDHFGDVSERAALFDSSYYSKAQEAYAHVLKLNPDDLDALRGIGNIDFDHRQYDEAIAAYEHYLSKQPNDPDVRTDLGTMYLSTGNADQAVVQYRKVLRTHPDFFQAIFNSGIAYAEMNDLTNARAQFEHALKLAPDQNARDRVNQMIASLHGNGGGLETASSGGAPAAPANPGAPTGGTFQQGLEAMLRGLPVAGPKVRNVQWTTPDKAKVMMDNFPMDQMPPFAASKFLGDLKAGIAQVKEAHKVTAPVEVDICDAASGRVMQTIKE
ncbi:MAG: tetratricopeptide repeat protein [Candidatus Binataceae bacterium]